MRFSNLKKALTMTPNVELIDIYQRQVEMCHQLGRNGKEDYRKQIIADEMHDRRLLPSN